MSSPNDIDKRDLAQMVMSMKDNDSTAQSVLIQNVVHSLWDSYGTVETDPDISDDDAEQILSELPVTYESESGTEEAA
jgi:hypothetical protein